MSSSSTLPNPLLKPEYSNLVNSSDPVAKNIVNDFTNIYINYVTFTNINSNVVDTAGLDNAATQIENSLNNIINILTPCATDPTPYSTPSIKCRLPACTWSNSIERLMVDFLVLFFKMTSPGETKSEYEFITFIAISNISQLITNTPNNKDPYNTKPTYYLCSDTKYYPMSPDEELQSQYNALKSRMLTQQTNKGTRQTDLMITQFLTYILLPTVIFIIAILLYLNFSSKKTNIVTSPVTSEQILTGVTTTEPAPNVKTGGAFYDTLNFFTTLSANLFRI